MYLGPKRRAEFGGRNCELPTPSSVPEKRALADLFFLVKDT